MENQKSSSKQVMLNYGLMLGAISILLSVSIYAMGKIYDQGWEIALISFVVMAVITFMGLKKFKEGNNNLLSLGEAIKIGLGIALVGGIISVIYNQVFINFIEPDFMENMMKVGEQKMLEQNPNMTDEQLEMAKGMQEKMSSPLIGAAMGIVGSLFFGFIISLIEGLILRKSDEEVTSI
jgi:drug/metabolite transporter (DMT)-like permease